MALWINTGHEHQAMEHPLLLAVSRQVQDEADAIYWGKHTWKVEVSAYGEGLGVRLDLSTPKAQLQEWDVLEWQLITTELRRKERGWQGEGIIEFFMAEHAQEFWASWCFTFPAEIEEKHEQQWDEELGGKEWWTTR
ncbi:hypothetical protein LTR15_006401 [Elasticomyces elasticus]|nr:hypothetical protein LTR15_006401 [Elasticomyces elasticus]